MGRKRKMSSILGWMDYGARMYDPSIGRWNGKDPFSEGYQLISPYTFAANNPIIFKDIDGQRITLFGDQGLREEFVNFLSNVTGLDLRVSEAGEVSLGGNNSDSYSSEYLRNLVTSILDLEGENYNNDVDFYLISGEHQMPGFSSSNKVFVDNFVTGSFDVQELRDFAKIDPLLLIPATFAHVLEERTKSTDNYRALLQRNKEAIEQDPELIATVEIQNAFDNGHLFGHILEGKVASEILDPDSDPESAPAAEIVQKINKNSQTIIFKYGRTSYTFVTNLEGGKVLRHEINSGN